MSIVSILFTTVIATYVRAEDAPCLSFNQMPFLMTHDAGTGYYNGYLTNVVKTQQGTFRQQLEAGARAFDLRPQKSILGYLGMHHGGVNVGAKLSDVLESDIISWSREHPDEVVILYVSHAQNLCLRGGSCKDDVTSLLELHNIPYIKNCDDLNLINSCNISDKARVIDPISGNVSSRILAVFDCMDENFDKSIGCYSSTGKFEPDFVSLEKDLEQTGFKSKSTTLLQMNQAHWQYSLSRFKAAYSNDSSTLKDVELSEINPFLSKYIDGITEFIANGNDKYSSFYFNFFEIDDILMNGTEITMALENYNYVIQERLSQRWRNANPIQTSSENTNYCSEIYAKTGKQSLDVELYQLCQLTQSMLIAISNTLSDLVNSDIFDFHDDIFGQFKDFWSNSSFQRKFLSRINSDKTDNSLDADDKSTRESSNVDSLETEYEADVIQKPAVKVEVPVVSMFDDIHLVDDYFNKVNEMLLVEEEFLSRDVDEMGTVVTKFGPINIDEDYFDKFELTEEDHDDDEWIDITVYHGLLPMVLTEIFGFKSFIDFLRNVSSLLIEADLVTFSVKVVLKDILVNATDEYDFIVTHNNSNNSISVAEYQRGNDKVNVPFSFELVLIKSAVIHASQLSLIKWS